MTYGVSESTVSRTIKKIEDVLVKSGEFNLPGKKVLQARDTLIEVILIDATEQPIERPKKTKMALLRQKEAAYAESTVDYRPKKPGNYSHSIWK